MNNFVNEMSAMSRAQQVFTFLQGKVHPIAPVLLKDARLAAEFANEMLSKLGFSLFGISILDVVCLPLDLICLPVSVYNAGQCLRVFCY